VNSGRLLARVQGPAAISALLAGIVAVDSLERLSPCGARS